MALVKFLARSPLSRARRPELWELRLGKLSQTMWEDKVGKWVGSELSMVCRYQLGVGRCSKKAKMLTT